MKGETMSAIQKVLNSYDTSPGEEDFKDARAELARYEAIEKIAKRIADNKINFCACPSCGPLSDINKETIDALVAALAQPTGKFSLENE